jgi:signal transduction histidine kinase
VVVNVERDADHARVLIHDDGRGFDPVVAAAAATSFGVDTMRERAEGVGGKFALSSRPGEGTRVEVELPLNAPKGRQS